MSADLILLDRVTDIIEEGYDLALRIGNLADSSLVAAPLGKVRYTLCASPSLIEKMGVPTHPEELTRWPVITFAPQGRQWSFENKGKTLTVNINPILTSNQIDPVLNAARAGLGAAMIISYQAGSAIRNAELVPLLENYMPAAVPVQFVYPHKRLLSPRVRFFLDWASPRIREILS